MAVMGEAARSSVGRQLGRGVAFTVALLVGLTVAFSAVGWLIDLDGDSDLSAAQRTGVGLAWLAIAAVLAVLWRRLRQWSGRPRWLVPAAVVIAVAGLTPAVIAPAPHRPAYISHCAPLADAWRPVMAAPTVADLAYMKAHPKPTHVSLNVMTRQQRDAYEAAFNAWLSSPAYSHVLLYQLWQDGPGPCGASSRTDLGRSAAGLGVGALALTIAVRRRTKIKEA